MRVAEMLTGTCFWPSTIGRHLCDSEDTPEKNKDKSKHTVEQKMIVHSNLFPNTGISTGNFKNRNPKTSGDHHIEETSNISFLKEF